MYKVLTGSVFSRFLAVLLYMLCGLIPVQSVKAQQPDISFQHYTASDGLPAQLIYAVRQDRQGFLWITSTAGVSRFDGKRFVNFTTEDGLGDNENLNIYEDKKGRIWFMPFSGKLSYYYKGKFYSEKNDSIIRLLPDHYINCNMIMAEDISGNIYIPDIDTRKGIKRLGADNSVFTYDLNHILKGQALQPGAIYASADGKRIYCRLNGNEGRYIELMPTGEVKELPPQISNYRWDTRRYIVNMESHSVLFYSDDTLYNLTDTVFTPLLPLHYDMVVFPVDFRFDHYGNIWHSSLNGVLFFKKTKGTYEKPLSLVKGQRSNVYFDREDNIWFATSTQGLYMLPYDRLRDIEAFGINSHTLQQRILATAVDSDRGLWLGYDNGWVSRVKNNHWDHYNLAGAAKADTLGTYKRIIQIQADGDGDVWCISDQFTVVMKRLSADQYAKPRILNYYDSYQKNIIPATGFKSIFLDNAGNICFSTAFTWPAYTAKINKVKLLLPIHSKQQTTALRQFTAFCDSKGGFYYSRSNGLHYKRGNNEMALFRNDKRLKARMQHFAENSQGIIFIASYSEGVVALKNFKIAATVTVRSGLAGIICRRIYCIRDTLYVATNGGVSVLVFQNDQFRVLYKLGVHEGLSSPDVNDLAFLDNTMYVATSTGMSTFRLPFKSIKLASAPLPVFTGFKVNEIAYDISRPIEFPYGEQRISISYIAPVASNASLLHYRYRFADREENWHITGSNELEVSRLPFGRYKLEIQAKKYNSNWSTSKVIAFTITPPFYYTGWFIALATVCGISMVFLLFRYLLRRRVMKQLADIRERAAIERERGRIAADIHDDIGAELTNIVILSQILKGTGTVSDSNVLDKLEASSNEVISKMNEVVWTLNHTNDTLYNLVAYLRSYIVKVAEKHNINAEFTIDETLYSDRKIGAEQRRNILLAVKEILHNVVKHSQARRMDIAMQGISQDIMFIEIHDHGIGFEIQEYHSGNGLMNIRKRAEALKSDLVITTAKGEGTRIQMNIPV